VSSGPRIALLGVLAALVVVMWGLAFISKRFEHVASGVAALSPRTFETLSLITVGTGGTFENPWRLGPALAVGHGSEIALVDAGRGVCEALRAAEIPTDQPRWVFLTSLLPENTVGLDDLWLTGWLGPREGPLRVYGPPGTRALVEALAQAHGRARAITAGLWSLPESGGVLEVRELDDGAEVAIGKLSVTATALQDGPFDALAYRFATDSRSLVIATEGFDPERILEASRDADTLVVSVIFGASLEAAAEAGVDRIDVLEREAERHLRVESVAELATRAGVRQLVLTRLRPPPVFDFQFRRLVQAGFRGSVVIASDGDLIRP